MVAYCDCIRDNDLLLLLTCGEIRIFCFPSRLLVEVELDDAAAVASPTPTPPVVVDFYFFEAATGTGTGTGNLSAAVSPR